MSFLGCFFCFFAKGFIEEYIKAPPGPSIKDRSLRDRNGEHFLQAHGLGAELDHVAVVKLWFAAFELHGKRLPRFFAYTVEFYHVSLANQAES